MNISPDIQGSLAFTGECLTLSGYASGIPVSLSIVYLRSYLVHSIKVTTTLAIVVGLSIGAWGIFAIYDKYFLAKVV
jgi:hypothetical protein